MLENLDQILTLHYQYHLRIPLLQFVLLVAVLVSTIHIKLVTTVEMAHLNPKDDELMPTFLDLRAGLDRCGYQDGYWAFCAPCHLDIVSDRAPKFSALNSVNVVMCHDYPDALKNLTIVEEAVIARRHPVGSILKLRPGNCRSPSSYYALRGHIVIIPQQLGPLFRILPSPDLRFQDIIKVFWVGKCQPSSDDLKPFLQIRKNKVLCALQWLVSNHCHYRDLMVNYPLLASWPEDFIPSQISIHVSHLDVPDHSKRESYVANLESDNFENNLQAVSDEVSDSNAVFSSGSLCTDLNGERSNCDLQLLHTLTSFVDKTNSSTNDTTTELEMEDSDTESLDDVITSDLDDSENEEVARPERQSKYIRFGFKHNSSPLANVWEDPLFFTTAFPTLFPTGSGGHLDNRRSKVSLEAFAQWSLSHHTRR
ncbi:hypothetical protein V8E54_002320 [Elaphomyces granulatus]